MIPVQRPCVGEEELLGVRQVFESRWLGLGADTAAFEARLRDFLGVKHALAVSSGTAALHLAVEALGLGPGDEVIVPSLTFIASAQAIVVAGATPVFCDVRRDTLNMDPDDVERRITSRTRALMPVHYGGYVCDMAAIGDLARRHRLRVIEDAAHAFGSLYDGRPVGALGDIACFSFDPIKNITCGEGGVVATGDDDVARRVGVGRLLGIENDTWSRMKHQRNWFYHVTAPGYRYHMPNINAAIGLKQLARLEEFKARKRAIVCAYDEAFRSMGGLRLLEHDQDGAFPFSYVVRVLGGRRDQLMAHLRAREIGSGVHYVPNHLQPLFACTETLPVTEQLFEEIVTLPLYVELSDAEVAMVIEGVQSFFDGAPMD